MSNFTIPNAEGQIRQPNRGDVFGELWSTFNIDLVSNPGKIKTSRRLKKILDTDDLGGSDIVALDVFGGYYYLTTIDDVLRCSVDEDPTFANNWVSAGTLGLEDLGFESDSVSFNGLELFSLGTDIMSYDGSNKDDDYWTNTISGTALTANKPHMLHVHRGGAETLIVTDDNKIRYYNAAAGHSTITLDSTFTASCLASGVSAVWAGTYTEQGSHAYVYEFYIGEQLDGTPVARNAYPIDGRAVLAVEVINNTPYIITEKGNVQVFNGVGFVTVASFPFAYQEGRLDGVQPGLVQDTSISRPVHPKGMKARNDSLYILINTQNSDGDLVDPRSPSGVWEYNSVTQVLNHRYSLPNDTTDKGASLMRRSGPLLITESPETTIMLAGEVDDGANTGIGLWMEDMTTAPYGYFVTSEIESETVSDSFERAILKAQTSDASIVVKYRITKRDTEYHDIVWLNATQFNTTSDFSNVEVGDEIEVIEGYRSGYLAHITAIEGTTTYTVTIDESIGLLNETATVKVENWTKLDDEYTSADGELKEIGVNQVNPWIQYKVQLKGNVELRQFISNGNAKQQL